MAVGSVTASSAMTGIPTKQREWVRTSHLCWFCLDELNKLNNIHHILPRRYFRNKAEANQGNTVRVCECCHKRWHGEFDRPKMSLRKYLPYMAELEWGFGIYVEG